MVCYRKMMNSNGWKKLDSLQGGEGMRQTEFCRENNAEKFPEFSNYFIMEYFQECIQDGFLVRDKTFLKFLKGDKNSQCLLIVILLI
jgi:hypothetical protein